MSIPIFDENGDLIDFDDPEYRIFEPQRYGCCRVAWAFVIAAVIIATVITLQEMF